MVLLDDTVESIDYQAVVSGLANEYRFQVVNYWSSAPQGFVCERLNPNDAEGLAENGLIKSVEEDFSFQLQSGVQTASWNGNYLWAIDRLDETSYYAHDGTYNMCPEAQSVYAYVIDTGVRTDHEQLKINGVSRVVLSLDFSDGSTNGTPDTSNACTAATPANMTIWHGTAVASLLAGEQIGAAKTKIISLRTIRCADQSGQASYVINAVRWIKSASDPFRSTASVVNYSGAIMPWSLDMPTMDSTVDTLVTTYSIPFFTAADNYAGDSCQFSPSRLAYTNMNHAGTVFSVGATSVGSGSDMNDYRWQEWVTTNGNTIAKLGLNAGSNGGRCVSAYAPGAFVYAARSSATNGYGTASGTSFAAPIAAAVAARYMERSGISTYQDVYSYLLSMANSYGAPVLGVQTPEYWMCQWPANLLMYQIFTSDPGSCSGGYVGYSSGTTPIHFPATNNESAAHMLFSEAPCP